LWSSSPSAAVMLNSDMICVRATRPRVTGPPKTPAAWYSMNDLAFGHIVVSETEIPNVFANLA
jgi:hypothetical protein